MTNPALEAFERLNLKLPFQDHLRKQYYEDIETIRTALANAPEVVTLPEVETVSRENLAAFLCDYMDAKTAKYAIEVIDVNYPNGLIVKGGA